MIGHSHKNISPFLFVANISLLVCDKASKITSLMKNIDKTPSLKTIVFVEPPTAEDKKLAEDKGIEMISYDNITKEGKKNPQDVMVSSLF